jgi:hypothetical protein
MELPSYFDKFLKEIRPTENQRNDLRTGHSTLRTRLNTDEDLKPILVSDFLQGSYRRATAVRPKDGKRSDVDIIVVTKLSPEEYEPKDAMKLFEPFLDKYYKGKWVPNGRSFGIELSYVDLDLVITAAPSEVEIGILQSKSVTADETPEDVDDWRLVKSWLPSTERNTLAGMLLMQEAKREAEWKSVPLQIPDRDVEEWTDTDPLAQIRWTWEKNAGTNSHYINLVKALKWWRRVKHSTPQYPKGYPVEHLIGQACPDGITSVAEGVTLSLEQMVTQYQAEAKAETTPILPDHGVPSHNVLKRVKGEDFSEFYSQICGAAQIARRAFDADTVRKSSEAWRELFGDKFPLGPEEKSSGYSPREGSSSPGGGRFA